jgi:hypothetical protein
MMVAGAYSRGAFPPCGKQEIEREEGKGQDASPTDMSPVNYFFQLDPIS